jgi:teichuronic acid biosynthesis glycosyltransferase TuaC
VLRVLTLSTLFPDASRPNFGVFVERQTLGLAAHPDVALTVIAPVGLPPWPLSRFGHYRALASLAHHETWKGLDVHRPRFTVIPGTGARFHAAALTAALRPVLDDLRGGFDVIDASFFFPDGPAAVALGERYGVPVSIKARGADIHHWASASASSRQILRAAQQADGLLAVSQAMADDMVALGMPRPRVHYTGVDLDRFVPGDRTALKREFGVTGPLVIAVGALIPRKGHDIVIDAVARLPGVSLLIAGDGPERAALTARAARNSNRIRLLGPVPHADLPRLFAAADVSALASSSEGLANAWIESLACGTPVVAADIGGAREAVTLGAGRVVPRDANAFAAAIRQLLANPLPTASVREAALRFTWQANTATLFDHLQQLLRTRPALAG